MRQDVQKIFKMTPHNKQVMMFSATLSEEIRPICKKFMRDVHIASSSSSSPLLFFLLSSSQCTPPLLFGIRFHSRSS
jgi:hypothetical protein